MGGLGKHCASAINQLTVSNDGFVRPANPKEILSVQSDGQTRIYSNLLALDGIIPPGRECVFFKKTSRIQQDGSEH
jgi:hypothetical protein